MERTIKVVGNGALTVKPDTIRLLLNLEGTRIDYNEVLELSARQIEELYSCLDVLDIPREDLKTLSFGVTTKNELQQDAQQLWKQVFIGYSFFQSLKLDIPNTNENLGKIIYAITGCSFSPHIQLQHVVKDTEAAKTELLENAVMDARKKAEIIARCAGVTLGEILSINYSWDDFDFPYSSTCHNLCERTLDFDSAASPVNSPSTPINPAPDDIKLSDTIMVIWKIQ